MDPTTDELLAACAANDGAAWGQLVERYARLVYSIPARHGLSEADRDDVVQTVFATLLSRIGTIRDARALPAWLIITTNRATWKHMKRLRDRTLPAAVEAAAEPDGAVMERLELQQKLYAGLAALGGRCETMLRAMFLERPPASYESVAARLGVPVDSIGPTRRRCLAKLARILADAGVLHEFEVSGASSGATGTKTSGGQTE